MVYFLYGEDTYSIQDKIAEIESSFLSEGNTDLNITRVVGGNLTLKGYLNIISAVSFWGSRGLIIIKNLLKENKDKELQKYLEEAFSRVPEALTVVFFESEPPDKKSSLFKKIKIEKTTIYFPLLMGSALDNWIKKQAAKFEVGISLPAIRKLELFVGGDLWRLENEVAKLSLYARSKSRSQITEEDISCLVVADNNPNIFDLTDSLAGKDLKRALITITRFSMKGEDESYLFNMIIGHIRKMLIIEDLLERQISPDRSLLHPFVIKKISSALRLFKKNELKKIYFKLQNQDAKIKSGRVTMGNALFDFVVDFCKVC